MKIKTHLYSVVKLSCGNFGVLCEILSEFEPCGVRTSFIKTIHPTELEAQASVNELDDEAIAEYEAAKEDKQ